MGMECFPADKTRGRECITQWIDDPLIPMDGVNSQSILPAQVSLFESSLFLSSLSS